MRRGTAQGSPGPPSGAGRPRRASFHLERILDGLEHLLFALTSAHPRKTTLPYARLKSVGTLLAAVDADTHRAAVGRASSFRWEEYALESLSGTLLHIGEEVAVDIQREGGARMS